MTDHLLEINGGLRPRMEVTWITRSNISLELLTAPLSILSLGAPPAITKMVVVIDNKHFDLI